MKHRYIVTAILLCTGILGCQKQQDWLDIKTNKADVVPTKLSDYQALLDYSDDRMNSNYPYLPLVSTDDILVNDQTWASGDQLSRNAYAWEPEIFDAVKTNDWSPMYATVSYTNICLEGLEKISRDATNAAAWDRVKGSALFFRALADYLLLQEFSAPYDASIAQTALGIVLRKSSDVNLPVKRATMAESWNAVIDDLKQAETLLPDLPDISTRPSKWAVRGLMARVSLAMNDYTAAKAWADKALQQNSYLLDFNTLSPADTYPLPTIQTGNKEILFYAMTLASIYYITGGVDTLLYQSYTNNDLRKTFYFKPSGTQISFRGQYSGVLYPFSGIANNEIYLIRAEANARLGNTAAALTDLNSLLIKRWKTGTFTPVTASSAADALIKILAERRKELVFHGSARWDDLRRLNREPAFAKTLTRFLNGKLISLPPGDKRYALPIPPYEIATSHIEQNPR
ncbi:MAG TPA: RagB/SusD family nutrient uptake outer membrane protein [Sediminibacterium sp.]|nr:RagB/SusD family nutrient uptake outer membrane protein [Sediminibacterium sp.]